MTERTDSKAWRVRRVAGREVFTAPEGGEYVRARRETAEVALAFPALGASAALYLRPDSAERLEKVAARRQRRLERREARRRERAGNRRARSGVTNETTESGGEA